MARECGFARAVGAHDGNPFTLVNFYAYIVQGWRGGMFTTGMAVGDVVKLDQRRQNALPEKVIPANTRLLYWKKTLTLEDISPIFV
jgi:hypothetical protein